MLTGSVVQPLHKDPAAASASQEVGYGSGSYEELWFIIGANSTHSTSSTMLGWFAFGLGFKMCFATPDRPTTNLIMYYCTYLYVFYYLKINKKFEK